MVEPDREDAPQQPALPAPRPAPPRNATVDGVRDRLRPWFVALLVSGLVILQVRAQKEQLTHGFRPLLREPVRVSFSWEMFAVRVARCDMEWSPPIVSQAGREAGRQAGRRAFSRIRDLSSTIEWNPVFDEITDYRDFAGYLCGYFATPNTQIRLTCFDGRFQRDEQVLVCP